MKNKQAVSQEYLDKNRQTYNQMIQIDIESFSHRFIELESYGFTDIEQSDYCDEYTLRLSLVANFSENHLYRDNSIYFRAFIMDSENHLLDCPASISFQHNTWFQIRSSVLNKAAIINIRAMGSYPVPFYNGDGTIAPNLCKVPFEIDYQSFSSRYIQIKSYGYTESTQQNKKMRVSVMAELSLQPDKIVAPKGYLYFASVLYDSMLTVVDMKHIIIGYYGDFRGEISKINFTSLDPTNIYKVKIFLSEERPQP